MPRVNDQQLPPDYAAAYNKTFGPTRPVAYPGLRLPSALDQVATAYPEHLEPPHVPTVAQLRERQYFQDVFECFNQAPDNERTAYWRLSRAGPLRYYNDYMHKNLPLRIEGFTCPYWAAPYARSFKSEEGPTSGHHLIELLDIDEHVFTIELELDPISVGSYPPPWPTPYHPYSLIHYWFDWSEVMWKVTELDSWNPTERSEYEESYDIPEIGAGDPIDRQIRFIRYGATDEGEAVVWTTRLDGEPTTFVGLNFE